MTSNDNVGLPHASCHADVSRAKFKKNTNPGAILLGLGALVLSFGILPYVYAVVAFGADYKPYVNGVVLNNILLNCCANAVVMLSALRLRDRFDRKLAAVLSRAVLVHGALGFFILVTRQFHSNEVMLAAVLSSIVFGSIFMFINGRRSTVRAAFLGPWHELVTGLTMKCDWIQDPGADLRGYDILLTANIAHVTPEWAEALSKAMLSGKTVRHLAEFAEENRGQVSLEHFDLDHLPAGGLTSYRTRKRILDLGLVFFALPIALPVLALASLAIVATMRGPVLFIQPRVGLGGRVFNIYKLRTMRIASDGGRAAVATAKNDQRITPLGRVFRRLRIDELPQLWNVLKGDMSIVGPRPEWTLLSERYRSDLPAYHYRHLVRPGITGWAQVQAGYAANLAETAVKVRYDLFYIKNFSFSLDLEILALTIWALIGGRGVR